MQNKTAVSSTRKTRASSRRNIQARAKAQEAVKLRLAGATHKQIANQLGYAGESGAYKAIMRELTTVAAEQTPNTEALRQISVQRLDQLLFSVWRDAIGGDQGAINTALKLEESRRNLLGIDAPKQYEARIRVDILSWNQALKDILEIYREVHGDSQEAPVFLERIDKLADDRFEGVV